MADVPAIIPDWLTMTSGLLGDALTVIPTYMMYQQ